MRWWRADRGQTRLDALVALAAFPGGWALLALGAHGSWLDVGMGARLACLAAGCVTLLLRRGMPIVALVLGTLVFAVDTSFGISAAGFIIYQDNLYSAVLYGPRRTYVYVGVGSTLLAGGTGAWIWALGDVQSGILTALIVIGCTFTPMLTGLVVRAQRQRATDASEHARQVARLSDMDRRQAVNAERTRMARELHDLVANQFSAIAVQSAALLSRPDLDEATRLRVLDTIRRNSVDGLAELRKMIELLRSDDETVDEPVSHRLDEADRLVERHRDLGLAVTLRVDGDAYEPPAAVELAGYRIVQESLVNAGKYGGGSAAVVIAYEPGRVSITVDSPMRMNGTGAEPVGVNAGAGLVGMRERALLLGGTFTAGPQGTDWRVRATLPVTRTATAEETA